MGYEIVDATYELALDLRSRLRDLDLRECTGQGMSLRRMIHKTFKSSLYAQAAVSDGKCIAMWGVCGPMLGDDGIPWLLTAAEVEKRGRRLRNCWTSNPVWKIMCFRIISKRSRC